MTITQNPIPVQGNVEELIRLTADIGLDGSSKAGRRSPLPTVCPRFGTLTA